MRLVHSIRFARCCNRVRRHSPATSMNVSLAGYPAVTIPQNCHPVEAKATKLSQVSDSHKPTRRKAQASCHARAVHLLRILPGGDSNKVQASFWHTLALLRRLGFVVRHQGLSLDATPYLNVSTMLYIQVALARYMHTNFRKKARRVLESFHKHLEQAVSERHDWMQPVSNEASCQGNSAITPIDKSRLVSKDARMLPQHEHLADVLLRVFPRQHQMHVVDGTQAPGLPAQNRQYRRWTQMLSDHLLDVTLSQAALDHVAHTSPNTKLPRALWAHIHKHLNAHQLADFLQVWPFI